ncbi:MAG: hypothetical protein AAGJ97_07570 [Planctomycetota bacterium]
MSMDLDRRKVFALVALAVAVPLLFPVGIPESVTPSTRSCFAAIEDLPDGSLLLVSFDYAPSGSAELAPMTDAFLRHAAEKRHRLLFLALWPEGAKFCREAEALLGEEYPAYEYGTDFVTLGYKAGLESVIKVITSDLRGTYATDVRGVALDDLPLTADLTDITPVDLIVSVSSGTPGTKEWVQYAATPLDTDIISGTVAVQAPIIAPYVPSQLNGLLWGLKGAAEYETLLAEVHPDAVPGTAAIKRMQPQHAVHLVIVGLIVLGNVLAVRGRGRRGPAGGGPATDDDTPGRRLLWGGLIVVAGVIAFAGVRSGGQVGTAYIRETTEQVSDGSTRPAFESVSRKEKDAADVRLSPSRTLGLWVAAGLTLAVFSFLIGDNPAYRFSESVFVGVSAAYWMTVGFWDELVPNLFTRLAPRTVEAWGVGNFDGRITEWDWTALVPLALSFLMLSRLLPAGRKVSTWALAFFVGATAGIKIVAYFEADFVRQLGQTITPLWVAGDDGAFDPAGTFTSWVALFAVLTPLAYFYFSAGQRGVLGRVGRVGIVVLMTTFGASFGLTVMGRVSLLIERFEFLFRDWLAM